MTLSTKFLWTVAVIFLSVPKLSFAKVEGIAEATVQVKFKNAAHAEHFMIWMSEQGEQDMYVWMEDAEPELAKIPTYDSKNLLIDYSLIP